MSTATVDTPGDLLILRVLVDEFVQLAREQAAAGNASTPERRGRLARMRGLIETGNQYADGFGATRPDWAALAKQPRRS